MKVINKLATSLNRRDEAPNLALAEQVAAASGKAAQEGVAELLTLLSATDKNIRSDSIKVLYELARLKPVLIAPHAQVFVRLLASQENRLVWGAMVVLAALATEAPQVLYHNLGCILDAAAKGSVIAKDHAVKLLAKLATIPAYAPDTQALLIDLLQTAPVNQLPTYAEQALAVVTAPLVPELERVLLARLPDVEQDTKRIRLKKVLKKLHDQKTVY